MRRIGVVVAAGLLVGLLATPTLAGGGGCHQPEQTEAAATIVHLSSNCFSPTVTRVAPGETVSFVNDDPVPHTVTGANLLWGSLDHMPSAATIEASFDRPGVYPYVCILHPGMTGAVVVGDADVALAAGPDIAGGDASTSTAGSAWGPLALGAVIGLGLAGAIAAVTRRRSAGAV